MRYTVVLEQEEDGGYVASVAALPGCVSQGDTRAEALKNIQEAIALYVVGLPRSWRSRAHRGGQGVRRGRGSVIGFQHVARMERSEIRGGGAT